MVSESTPSTSVDPADRYGSDNPLVNALIGALAGIILSFIPLSPLLGGGIAGYLEDGDTSDGLRVGAIAGGIMLLPFVFFGFFVMVVFMGFGMNGGAPLAFGLMLVFMLFMGVLYTVGLSAVGGFLGIYIKDKL